MPENHFGYEPLLDIETEYKPSDDQLNELSKFMAKPEPAGIPAGYTYLGQFIDHDISLDSAGEVYPWDEITPSSIFNKRNPFLNLETVYGSNETSPTTAKLLKDGSNTLLRLGDTVPGNSLRRSFPGKDLPRIPGSPVALIVDKRNDENLLVAQTQLAFMRFHNAVVAHIGDDNKPETFETAREIVIQHYQWIVLRDYLPKIVKESVLNDVLKDGNRFYRPNPKTPYMPLEFSVAAFRVAHSMVRNSYNWNRIFNDDNPPFLATLRDLTKFTGRGGMSRRKNLISEWVINWYLFYEITGVSQGLKFNFAADINTKLARTLGFLPDRRTHQIPTGFNRETSLAALDLYRTRVLGLPSGQMVAERILGEKERILKPEQIAALLPGNLKCVFSKETPLWFYLLAEAEIEERGRRMGEVGSRIVAETLVELIKLSTPSIFNDGFQPRPDFYVGDRDFGMREMLRFVAAEEKKQAGTDFDPLNPLGKDRACQC